MSHTNPSAVSRDRRKQRIRKTVFGEVARPRMSVFRSANHIYAQIIDDTSGRTLVAASTLSKDLGDHGGHGGNISAAQAVGRLIAARAQASNISKVVFDRNGYLYHGRIKALADAAREAGLDF
jgi:large subunit ribosomal protein L18